MTLQTGLRQAEPLAGLMCLSGYLPVAAKVPHERAIASQGVPIYMAKKTGMPVLMSKKTWDSMSATERKIITDAANEAKAEERRIAQATEAKAIESLRKSMEVNGVTASEVS